jgi:hypothetical protein
MYHDSEALLSVSSYSNLDILTLTFSQICIVQFCEFLSYFVNRDQVLVTGALAWMQQANILIYIPCRKSALVPLLTIPTRLINPASLRGLHYTIDAAASDPPDKYLTPAVQNPGDLGATR